MNQNRVISTAVLFLLLGTTIPAFAQKGQEKKGGGEGKAQQAQHQQQPRHAQQAQRSQHTKQAQHTQRAQRTQQPRRVQQAQRSQQPQRARQARRQQQPRAVANNRGNNGNHYGRIPDDRYRAHFGRVHAFRMGRPQFIDGYNRFQYSGYWFGYNQPWPSGWDYNDDVYVVYVGGAYYMYNRRHSGIHITLNLF
jgi:hypothetical protein